MVLGVGECPRMHLRPVFQELAFVVMPFHKKWPLALNLRVPVYVVGCLPTILGSPWRAHLTSEVNTTGVCIMKEAHQCIHDQKKKCHTRPRRRAVRDRCDAEICRNVEHSNTSFGKIIIFCKCLTIVDVAKTGSPIWGTSTTHFSNTLIFSGTGVRLPTVSGCYLGVYTLCAARLS